MCVLSSWSGRVTMCVRLGTVKRCALKTQRRQQLSQLPQDWMLLSVASQGLAWKVTEEKSLTIRLPWTALLCLHPPLVWIRMYCGCKMSTHTPIQMPGFEQDKSCLCFLPWVWLVCIFLREDAKKKPKEKPPEIMELHKCAHPLVTEGCSELSNHIHIHFKWTANTSKSLWLIPNTVQLFR